MKTIIKRIILLITVIFFVSYAYRFVINKASDMEQNKKPLVSVLIPAYNHEKYIEYTLNSIIKQTYPNIELIIIDDGSVDNTFKVIKDTLEKHAKRFKYVHIETQKNQGIPETLNRLIFQAHGKYTFITASDDMAKPNTIEREVEFLQKNPNYVLAVGDNDFIDEQNNYVYADADFNLSPTKIDPSYKKTFGELMSIKSFDNYLAFIDEKTFGTYSALINIGNHITNGYMIRTHVLKKVKFKKETPLEDYYLMLQLSKFGKFKFINDSLFDYRRHQTNISSKKDYLKKITLDTLNFEMQERLTAPIDPDYSLSMKIYLLKLRFRNFLEKYKN